MSRDITLRREWDSNPRWAGPTTVFETVRFGHSRIPPFLVRGHICHSDLSSRPGKCLDAKRNTGEVRHLRGERTVARGTKSDVRQGVGRLRALVGYDPALNTMSARPDQVKRARPTWRSRTAGWWRKTRISASFANVSLLADSILAGQDGGWEFLDPSGSPKRGWRFERPSAMTNSRPPVRRSRIERPLLQWPASAAVRKTPS